MFNQLRKIKKAIQHPELIPLKLIPGHLLPDSFYLKCLYKNKTGKKLNLNNPLLYNEKIQWLKLYDRQQKYSNLSDKYEVRDFITHTIGNDYLVHIYGVWNSFDEIPFNELPNEFVLKCTHDSGSIIFCKNKNLFDIPKTRDYFLKILAKNYYWDKREWAYKNIRPRIIAEKLMIDESSFGLKDYKIFCFNGEPKIIQVDFDRFTDHKRNFYSLQWEYQPFALKYPTAPQINIPRPSNLLLMLELAKKLSVGITHVRVDFYSIGNKIFFGELTFYHGAGFEHFDPSEWNRIFGDWMILPN